MGFSLLSMFPGVFKRSPYFTYVLRMLVIPPNSIVFSGQGFYNDYLNLNDYKQNRFHTLAKSKGVPANMVAHALERNKARLGLNTAHPCNIGWFPKRLFPKWCTHRNSMGARF